MESQLLLILIFLYYCLPQSEDPEDVFIFYGIFINFKSWQI